MVEHELKYLLAFESVEQKVNEVLVDLSQFEHEVVEEEQDGESKNVPHLKEQGVSSVPFFEVDRRNDQCHYETPEKEDAEESVPSLLEVETWKMQVQAWHNDDDLQLDFELPGASLDERLGLLKVEQAIHVSGCHEHEPVPNVFCVFPITEVGENEWKDTYAVDHVDDVDLEVNVAVGVDKTANVSWHIHHGEEESEEEGLPYSALPIPLDF